jgi:hypothetical protein
MLSAAAGALEALMTTIPASSAAMTGIQQREETRDADRARVVMEVSS